MKHLPLALATTLLLVANLNAAAHAKRASDHWAFQPLADPAVPQPRDTRWPRTDLDRVIRAAQEKKNLQPNNEADRRVLMRRAYFDLIGLPPTSEEVQAFAADPDPQAYEKLIQRLLDNPHYGERWGRHWLDVARYADSNGYRYDDDQPVAFHYRDFVIRAFNQDLPYDRFIQWQLAGQELAPDNLDAVTANGFAAIGAMERDEGPPLVRKTLRSDEMDDIVGTAASATLALTVSCARCHDHKFDPISTKEFYQLVRAFNGGKREILPVQRPVPAGEEAAKADFDRERATLLADLQAWEEANRAVFQPIYTELKKKLDAYHKEAEERFLRENPDAPPAFLAKEFQSLAYEGIRRTYFGNEGAGAYLSTRRNFSRLNDHLDEYNPLLVQSLDEQLPAAQKAAFQALAARREKLQASRYFNHDQVLFFADSQTKPRPTFVLARGSDAMPTQEVGLGFLDVLTSPDYRLRPPPANGGNTSYQRAALADWIVDVERGAGRLLARVMVNRIWQYHFGEGLIRTPNDFGIQGDRPEDPALLDWLARRFIASGWSVKAMHRLIMTSSVYRQSTDYDATRSALDPDNRLWWRRAPQRLSSEILRDTILATSGRLNPEFFGPGVLMPIPKEAIITRSGRPYPTNLADTPETWRRSIYAFAKRTVPIPLIQVFDGADMSISCGRRIPTTVPTQALTLMNNATIRTRSEDFAARVALLAPGSLEEQVRFAFNLALARQPDDAEWSRISSFLVQQADHRSGDRQGVLADWCQAIFNLNEFIYID